MPLSKVIISVLTSASSCVPVWPALIAMPHGRPLSLVLYITLREHNVSSDALMPTWVPFAATKAAEEVLVFSLRLMTGLCS